jgi:hypothetical protein
MSELVRRACAASVKLVATSSRPVRMRARAVRALPRLAGHRLDISTAGINDPPRESGTERDNLKRRNTETKRELHSFPPSRASRLRWNLFRSGLELTLDCDHTNVLFSAQPEVKAE